MFKKSGMIVLAISIGGLLSSCHIEQKDEETIQRTTEYLRIYQANDFIEYSVIAVTNSGTFNQGALRVEWKQTADLTDPIDGETKYTVLKETTTLTYESDSTETDATIIRYISQDDNGSVKLYAIDDGTGLYWLYDPADTGTPSSPILPSVIFDSPMAVGVSPPNTSALTTPVKFSVMEGCGVAPIGIGLCGPEVYTFNDSFAIEGDSTSVTTNLGKFLNPFEISFNGGSIPKNSPALAFLGDIRDVCGTSVDNITHDGIMFIMPEIGIVQIRNTCINNGTNGTLLNYTITMNNTNIPLPPSSP